MSERQEERFARLCRLLLKGRKKSLPWRGLRDLGIRSRSALPLATEGTQETLLKDKKRLVMLVKKWP